MMREPVEKRGDQASRIPVLTALSVVASRSHRNLEVGRHIPLTATKCHSAGVGSPRDSISRFAQLKKAAPWITSAISRLLKPSFLSLWMSSWPNCKGVAVRETDEETRAFHRLPRSVSVPDEHRYSSWAPH